MLHWCIWCIQNISSVVPIVHNGPASWLFSSMFFEKFSDSGRSNVGSGGVRPLDEDVLENSRP